MGKIKITPYSAPKYTEYGKTMSEQAGKLLAEALIEKGHGHLLKEQFGISFKEEVNTSTADGAYTTMLSTTLYTAAINEIQNVMDLVNINDDLKNKGGFGAYKIPIQQPTVAYEVAEGAICNWFDEGVESITVTPKKYVAGTSITWEILKRGMTDFAKYVLQNAADAVKRKLATEIVNGLAAGAGNTTASAISYTTITTGEQTVNSATDTLNSVPYGFTANKLVIAASKWATFLADTDVKNVLYRVGARPGDKVEITVGWDRLMFGNMEVVLTPFLTSASALVLDSKKAAMLVRESDLETFEGQIPGRPYDREIVGLMSFSLAVIYSKAIYSITG